MTNGIEGEGIIAMGVSGALAKEYAADQRAFLPMLAGLLKSALPDEVHLLESGLFKKTIRGVVIQHGENRLTLEDLGRGPLQASFTRVVRGIALKTEAISVDEWLALASAALEQAASQNAAARSALANVLGLN